MIGEVQGTIFYGQELTDTAILEVGHWVCQATSAKKCDGSIAGSEPRQSKLNKKLTARESEVLFLLLFGKKPQYIAQILTISIKLLRVMWHALNKSSMPTVKAN